MTQYSIPLFAGAEGAWRRCALWAFCAQLLRLAIVAVLRIFATLCSVWRVAQPDGQQEKGGKGVRILLLYSFCNSPHAYSITVASGKNGVAFAAFTAFPLSLF